MLEAYGNSGTNTRSPSEFFEIRLRSVPSLRLRRDGCGQPSAQRGRSIAPSSSPASFRCMSLGVRLCPVPVAGRDRRVRNRCEGGCPFKAGLQLLGGRRIASGLDTLVAVVRHSSRRSAIAGTRAEAIGCLRCICSWYGPPVRSRVEGRAPDSFKGATRVSDQHHTCERLRIGTQEWARLR